MTAAKKRTTKGPKKGESKAPAKPEVTIVIPADGPSFGVAPSGTCRCKSSR